MVAYFEQSNAQNSLNQATTVCELRTSRHSSWSNCRHPLDHWKSKSVPENHLLLLYWLCQCHWLCGSQQNVEILQETGIPDHLTCLLRNLYAGQEATVRTRRGTKDWFQIGKGLHQVHILSPCMFSYMQNTSQEMPDWMRHRLKWRFLGEIAITSDM